MFGRLLSSWYEDQKVFEKAAGNVGQDHPIKGDKNAPFGGVVTHEVGDGRVEEEYTGMGRRDKYMQTPGGLVNGDDDDRDTVGVKEVANHE